MEVSTPSPGPSSAIHTPPAPLHGSYADSWEPYTPRKSARLSQRSANRTPSPSISTRHFTEDRSQSKSLGSPKPSKSHRASNSMASPATSPQKKRAPATNLSRRASGTLTAESTASAAVALGLARHTELQPGRASISTVGGMLITPIKTPKKSPTLHKAKIQEVARSLFSESEVMPSPKKVRPQKHVLDSFSADDNMDEPIEIFTDSHERIPEVDRSAENPFFGDHPNFAGGALRRSKRHTVAIPGEGKVPVDEAVRREDGMVIVFRGKKQFRKFAKQEPADNSETGETRSVIMPRLLFPTKAEAAKIDTDDEEAATDIEDHALPAESENNPVTPMDLIEDAPGTPEAPKFAPATPPTTARTTRFGGKKAAEASPMKPKEKELKVPDKATRSKRSLFDSWRRVKGGSGSSETHGQKRSGEALPESAAKRTRA